MAGPSALRRAVSGKVVAVTGASEGIGARLACRLAAAGARVALVARSMDKLEAVKETIDADGGEAHLFSANLSSEPECERVLGDILGCLGRVDIFVSNAGRSIRRSVKYQWSDRFHDFQRLMALNYFGALRLILGVLPGMEERGSGQVVHVSSFGVPTRQPRFAGYCASKSALDAALQCAAGEVASKGVAMSTVYMPLVKTKMVESKGHSYDHVSMLSVDEACEYIEHAIITKRAEVIDAPSRFLSLMHTFNPSWISGLNSLVYRLEGEKAPDDVAAKALRRSETRQLKMKAASKNRLLSFLASFMWFFSRLELVLHVRGGLPWALRDIFTFFVLVLVTVATPICAALVALAGGVRARCHRARCSGPAPAGSARPAARVRTLRFAEPEGCADGAHPRGAAERPRGADGADGADGAGGAAAAAGCGAVPGAGASPLGGAEELAACRRPRRALQTMRSSPGQSWCNPTLRRSASMTVRGLRRRRTFRLS